MNSNIHKASQLFTALVVSLSLLSLGSCALTPQSEELIYKPLQESATATVVDHRSTYVREVTPEESLQSQKVNVVGRMPLIDVLRKQLPNVSIMPADANVDMTQELDVHAKNLSALDFLKYLSALTGYDISFTGGKVVIKSFIRKEWNLAIFSAKRDVSLQVGKAFSSDSGGGQNTFNGLFSDDEWSRIVAGAERILGVTGKQNQSELAPFVQGVRSIGILNAGGEPHRINALDDYISSIVNFGSKQINIAVQAYEVTLDDKRGVGINWKELASVDGTVNGNSLNTIFRSKGDATFTGLFENQISFANDSVKATAIIDFLSTFGEVELLNQPNVTVRNGTYAYISAGEELTYIGEIEVEDDAGGDDKTTAKVESIRVGVTLSVAPRILKDGRILLEIWPSISSANLDEKVAFGNGSELILPKIQLQELATEVITESGRPVQLGGFIRRSVAKSLSELPWQERITGKIFNPIFRTETSDLQRTELVLTVTPTVVEGV